MNISERCRELRARITERERLLKANKEAESIRARVDEFVTLRADIQRRLEQRMRLIEHRIPYEPVRNPSPTIELLHEVSRQVSEDYDEAGRAIGKLKRALGVLRDQLTALVAKAIADLKGGIPASDEVFLKQIEEIPSYNRRVTQIRDERDAILSGNDPMTSPEALQHFLEHLGSLKAATDTLNPNEFSDAVLKFFKAVRRGGARLDDLTPEVRGWLEQKSLLKQVRITLAS
jgi:DNA repair exonuclease SbcCD ATPase subunit